MNQATQIIPFTTSGSLVDYVDRKVIVVLRDGKKLIGILRSFDQFANLMLQYTIERIYVDDMYGDIDRGVYIVRGENVVLLGELDLDKEYDAVKQLRRMPAEELYPLAKLHEEEKKKNIREKGKYLHSVGFSVDGGHDDLY
ncbi:U6 snRNA-associated Sm-like protein LSm1 [Schizosaccharomyces pombe]|uniref:LSM1-LSM7 complex subunit lsm1 n=1 Tax=Schizosaccharomyces pombe (strain 972 / ATCC 24843) TaxID=284812 RepID=LSM1_SCHPO|nr:putative mRNA-decapping complex subunit lsm1 [Schizosaccharomyces pombe]P87173.1 RecName: Full=U6 snRNA-associated Sm-like protein LSm1 [Schizosaccharomyces pombe 972h-]CAB09117.1 mRNA decapping complex subunit (predicted) [Schizosaccharomyces pombe]|eukprot:NP_595520.1 putative mRNA-decapping complex subunit lsm1 [Schizosaccharomyces pombe]